MKQLVVLSRNRRQYQARNGAATHSTPVPSTQRFSFMAINSGEKGYDTSSQEYTASDT